MSGKILLVDWVSVFIDVASRIDAAIDDGLLKVSEVPLDSIEWFFGTADVHFKRDRPDDRHREVSLPEPGAVVVAIDLGIAIHVTQIGCASFQAAVDHAGLLDVTLRMHVGKDFPVSRGLGGEQLQSLRTHPSNQTTKPRNTGKPFSSGR